MNSVMSFQKKKETKTVVSTGMFLSTVAIHLQGAQSSVLGALDLLTQDWLDQLVWEGISQSILPSNPGLELRSITAVKSRSESTCPRSLIGALNGLSRQDKRLATSLDPTLTSLASEYASQEKTWNISLKPEKVMYLQTLLNYMISLSSSGLMDIPHLVHDACQELDQVLMAHGHEPSCE